MAIFMYIVWILSQLIFILCVVRPPMFFINLSSVILIDSLLISPQLPVQIRASVTFGSTQWRLVVEKLGGCSWVGWY